MTRKKLIKLLMAKHISRNDAVAIAKFIHDDCLPYAGTKVYVSTVCKNGKRHNYISIHHKKWGSFWYSFYDGIFIPEGLQGTSSLEYLMMNYNLECFNKSEDYKKSLVVRNTE